MSQEDEDHVLRCGNGSGRAAEPTARRSTVTTRSLDVLLGLTRSLIAAPREADVPGIIMDAALEYSSAERGILMCRDDSGRLMIRLERHASGEEARALCPPFSRVAVNRCIESAQPVVIQYVSRVGDPPHGQILRAAGLRGIVSLPLVLRREVVGILYLDSRRACAPLSPDQVEILKAIAAEAAVSLENARLHRLARLDPLTRLSGRRHFDACLEHEFGRALSGGLPLSLLFLDVDRFKSVNDTYGHQTGDQVLREVARLLPAISRTSDIAARYGGEEFVLLSPETRAAGATLLAERVGERIRLLRFGHEYPHLRVTVTIGVSMLDLARMRHPGVLVRAADRAMYRAKALGGDRIVVDPEL